MSKQLNVRLPDSTRELLDELMERLDMTQVQVLIVAIEHLAAIKTAPAEK